MVYLAFFNNVFIELYFNFKPSATSEGKRQICETNNPNIFSGVHQNSVGKGDPSVFTITSSTSSTPAPSRV